MFDFNNDKLRLPATIDAGQTVADFVAKHRDGHLNNYTLSAKSQVYRGMMLGGVNEERTERAIARTGNRLIKFFNSFNSYYGIDAELYRIAQHFGAAAYGAESSRQVLGMFGPPGSAKSAISDDLKRILVNLEQMAYLEGSPMRDNILSVYFLMRKKARQVSESQRIPFAQALADVIDSMRIAPLLNWKNRNLVEHMGKLRLSDKTGMDALLAMPDSPALVKAICFGLDLPKTTVANVGYPDPMLEAIVLGLHGVEASKELADLQVAGFNYEMDLEGAVGIATLTEVDEKFFSNTKMYGSLNMRALLEHDPVSPFAAFFDGVYCVGSRGITEFVEGIKSGKQCMRGWLEQTQRNTMPSAGRIVRNTFIDTSCVVTSNLAEWYERFVNVPDMAPYLSRIDDVIVPYPRDYTSIVQVIGKIDNMSDFTAPVSDGGCHEQPRVRDYLAMFAAGTRIKPREGKKTMELVHLYAGNVDRLPFSQQNLNMGEFLDDAPAEEGVDGEDDRSLNKRFLGPEEIEQVQHAAYIAATNPNAEPHEVSPCVTTRAVKRRIKRWIKQNVKDKERQTALLQFVDGDLEKERLRFHADEFYPAAELTFENHCQTVFINYMEEIDDKRRAERNNDLSHAQAKVLEETARQIEGDAALGITEAGKKDFRSFLVRSVAEWSRKKGNEGKEISYRDFPLIAEPIRKLVARRNKETLAVFIGKANAVRREEDRQKADSIRTNLIAHGHCPKCAHEVEVDARESDLFAEVR